MKLRPARPRLRAASFVATAFVALTACSDDDSGGGGGAAPAAEQQEIQQPDPQTPRYTPPSDTTNPKTPSVFAATTGSELGTVTLAIDHPALADFHEIQYRRTLGTTPPADCDSGTLVGTVTDFSQMFFTDTGLFPGIEYSYRACIKDDADNLVEVTSNAAKAGSKQRIFATSALYDGNFAADFNDATFDDGISGADARCQHHADAADLGGKWRAVLSHSLTDPLNQIPFYGPVYNMAGEQIAKSRSTFWSGALDAAILYDEMGAEITEDTYAWSGFSSTGYGYDTYTCDDWSSTSGTGLTGNVITAPSDDNPDHWAASIIDSCANTFRLYCVESVDADFATPTVTATVDGGDVDVEVEFAEMHPATASVVVYRDLGAFTTSADCYSAYSRVTLKTYLGGGSTPFTDDVFENTPSIHGYYTYYSCIYDNWGNLRGVSEGASEAVGTDFLKAYITTTTHTGLEIDSPTTANGFCEAGYKALISESGSNAVNNIGNANRRQIFDMDGTFAGDIYMGSTAYLYGNIATHFDGTAVAVGTTYWTGTNVSGSAASDTCTGWTSADMGVSGTVGSVRSSLSYGYVNTTTATCDQELPIVCVEDNN